MRPRVCGHLKYLSNEYILSVNLIYFTVFKMAFFLQKETHFFKNKNILALVLYLLGSYFLCVFPLCLRGIKVMTQPNSVASPKVACQSLKRKTK